MARLIIITLIVGLCTIVSSCSSATQNTISKNKNSSTIGLPLHGNFCGPKIPNNKGLSRIETIYMLENIEPIDSIDFACKKHDLCYAENGYFNRACDNNIISELNSLSAKDTCLECERLSEIIVEYFSITNPEARHEYILKFVAYVSGEVIWVGLNTIVFACKTYAKALTLVIPPFIGWQEGTFESVDDGVKLYPDRYDVCTFK